MIQFGFCSWVGDQYWPLYPTAFTSIGYVFAWDGGVGRGFFNAWGMDPAYFRILSDNGSWSAGWIAVGY